MRPALSSDERLMLEYARVTRPVPRIEDVAVAVGFSPRKGRHIAAAICTKFDSGTFWGAVLGYATDVPDERPARRLVAEALLRADPTRTDLGIARHVGLSQTHVWRLRKRLERAGDVTRGVTRIDSLGRSQPPRRPRPRPVERSRPRRRVRDVPGQVEMELIG